MERFTLKNESYGMPINEAFVEQVDKYLGGWMYLEFKNFPGFIQLANYLLMVGAEVIFELGLLSVIRH